MSGKALMDKIRIVDLPVFCFIGVPEIERASAQELRIDAELTLDVRAAARGDDFSHAVDYAAAARMLVDTAKERCRKLIETLAEDAAAALLATFPVERVRVRVRKPRALAEFGAACAEVEIERSRDA